MAKVSRRTWGVSLLISLGVIALIGPIYYLAPNFLYVIEFNLFDQHFRLRGPRPANPQVAIVAIDEASVRAVGRWPWSRAVLADLVRRLDQAGAAAIAFDVLISEPEPSTERAALEKLTRRLGERNLDAPVRAELQKMASEADPDAALAAAIRAADRVVLASNFVFGSVPTAAPERKGSPMKSAIGVRSATDPPPASKAAPFTNYPERGDFPPLHATEETFPLPSLLAAASAVGHVNMIQESDGSTRYEALIVESRGYYYPGLAIEAIRVAAGLDPSARQVAFGDSIKLGDIVIPTDARSRVLIDYAGPRARSHTSPRPTCCRARGSSGSRIASSSSAPLPRGCSTICGSRRSRRTCRESRSTPTWRRTSWSGRFIRTPGWIELAEMAGIISSRCCWRSRCRSCGRCRASASRSWCGRLCSARRTTPSGASCGSRSSIPRWRW